MEALASFAEATFSRMPASQARPCAGSRNDRNSYRPVIAGTRVNVMCWMSSNSSMAQRRLQYRLLHLIQHGRHGALYFHGFSDLISSRIRVLRVLKKTWALVIPEELVDRSHIPLPILGESFEICKYCRDAGRSEERHCVLDILVEVGVEDALIHEIRVAFDVEQDPAQVMQFERRKNERIVGYRFFDRIAVLANGRFAPGLDLREDREAVVCRSSRINQAVSSLLLLEGSPFGDSHGRGLGPIALLCRCCNRRA